MINIGIPSKSKLKKKILKNFSKNKLKTKTEKRERNLLRYIKG